MLDKFRQLFLIKKVNLDLKYNLKNISLNDLFREFNADKGSEFKINGKLVSGHNYSPFYEKYLSRYKGIKKLNILEIGSLRGAATASFFYYFTNPQIFCADINPFQIQVFSKNIRKLFVDTQSEESLLNLRNYLSQKFDIIIDDGSHNIRDQIITIKILFDSLKNGGLYVIEDISQYLASKNLNTDNLDYGAKEILLSIEKKETINCNYITIDEANNLQKQFKKVHFEKGNYIENNINISDIVFIEKN